MIRAIAFDMGGTLDGDGVHWLDRFAGLYAAAGVVLSREALRAAFDAAEHCAAADEVMATARLDAMIARHVDWQLAELDLDSPALRQHLVDGFVAPVRAAARANAAVLADLSGRGLRLGVVSNGCGNVAILCADLGYAPYLTTVVDSHRVGLCKPDPAIFIYAAAGLDVHPSHVLMVGDSFDRDIRPARAVGMSTAWLEGPIARACPDPAMVDLHLQSLADLPGALEGSARVERVARV